MTAAEPFQAQFGTPKRGKAAELRRGWTTGACATAATKAAFIGWITGEFPDPIEILLPRGAPVGFALACYDRTADGARAGVVKDAGDDPDVTNGLLIISTVRPVLPAAASSFAQGLASGRSHGPDCRSRRASPRSTRRLVK